MSQETVPPLLYHGSLYKQNELMPGFKRSGMLMQWDGTGAYTVSNCATRTEQASACFMPSIG